MPCDKCGCYVTDYFKKRDKVEFYQGLISDLYDKKPIPKAKIRRLKIKRDKLLSAIEWLLQDISPSLRKEFFKDHNVPIQRDGSRRKGREYAEVTDLKTEE